MCGEGSEEGGEEEAGEAEGKEGVYVGQAVGGWCVVRFGRLAWPLRARRLVKYGRLLGLLDLLDTFLSSAASHTLLVPFNAVPDASCVHVSRSCH